MMTINWDENNVGYCDDGGGDGDDGSGGDGEATVRRRWYLWLVMNMSYLNLYESYDGYRLCTEMKINIEFEDESRCLFSLNKSKTANVAFPTFSGTTDEDYLKFEREMRDCIKRNRIRREDQSRKLREMFYW